LILLICILISKVKLLRFK